MTSAKKPSEKAISELRERKKSFAASKNRLRKCKRLAKVGDFEEKRRFPEKGPRFTIESGRVLRTTGKSDRVVEKVVRARFEIDRSRESSITGLRERFRRDSTFENASRRRIIALGTSNEAKRRRNRSKNDDFRKGPLRNRSPPRGTRPFAKVARDGTSSSEAIRRRSSRTKSARDLRPRWRLRS